MNTANTLFMILSSVLVLFMTPGLAFFYGGLVSKKNVVNTLMSVYVIIGLTIILWVAFGYTLSFSGDIKGIIGNLHNFFMNGVHLNAVTATGVPDVVFSLFEMMFAVITPALFVGAVVGRLHFKFLLVFTILWSILIYYPMVHMVWSPLGFLAKLGVLDFAGGTVVHIDAGITALVLAIFLGHRLGYAKPIRQYSLPWVLLGVTILWIGWYGFNVGSAFAVNTVAAEAALTTTVSTGASILTWLVLDMCLKGKTKLDGISNGTLCGLVGITPAAGFVTINGSFWIGIIATLASYTFINYVKPKIHLDDTLDAFGCHGISGITGSILTGCFATKAVNSAVINNGLFYGGGFHQLLIQIIATVFTIVFVAIIDIILVKLIEFFIPMRATHDQEQIGMDETEHGQKADHVAD